MLQLFQVYNTVDEDFSAPTVEYQGLVFFLHVAILFHYKIVKNIVFVYFVLKQG